MAGTISRRSFHLLVGVYISAHLAFASAKVLRHPSSAIQTLPAGSLQVGGLFRMPDVEFPAKVVFFLSVAAFAEYSLLEPKGPQFGWEFGRVADPNDVSYVGVATREASFSKEPSPCGRYPSIPHS